MMHVALLKGSFASPALLDIACPSPLPLLPPFLTLVAQAEQRKNKARFSPMCALGAERVADLVVLK